ncbi:MAG: hypothetical protein V2I33_07910 [Kangiellaceae bacterium]|jgi:hypothetical protein|nr:hypothetical protein [Kangiellaceae bacterium]
MGDKVTAVLVLVLVSIVAAVLWLTETNQTKVYQFCDELARGNPISRADQLLSNYPELLSIGALPRLPEEQQTTDKSIAYSHRFQLPLLTQYICRVSYRDSKITDLSLERR